MKQYGIFKWDDDDNLVFLGEDETGHDFIPEEEYSFEDVAGEVKVWIISEVHNPNPSRIKRPDGTEHHPDSIVILRPKNEE